MRLQRLTQHHEQQERRHAGQHAALAAIDLAWDTVDPEFRVGIGTAAGGGQVSAEDYRSAVERYGRPDLSEEDLTGASAEHRELLDQLLVASLPIRSVPPAAVFPLRDSCRTVSAGSEVTETIELNSPLLQITAERDVVIRLGRFGSGATAAAWKAPGGRAIGYRIPPDRSWRPWRIGFQGEGAVTVCEARAGFTGIRKNS